MAEEPDPARGNRRPVTPRSAGYVARRVVVSARFASRRATRATVGLWDGWLDRFERLGLSENATVLMFAIAVGLAAAIGVVVFYRAIDLVFTVLFDWPIRSFPNLSSLAYRPLVTGAALAVAASIWRRAGARQDGTTVPDIQLAVVKRSGRISGRAAAGRTAASAVTIGGGGSAGSEGPVAVLGAAAGSLLSQAFRFSAERTVVLVGAGTAAGIAAAFNAPLAGAFFALEEILGSLRLAAFPPIVMASVVGAVVSRAVFGNHPAFPIPRAYGYAALVEILVFFPLLGALCGARLRTEREGVLETINRVGSAFYGPVLAVFTLGILAPRLTGSTPIAGLAAGLAANLALSRFAPGVSWLWWNPAGFFVACGVALALGRIAPQLGIVRWPRQEARLLIGAFIIMMAILVGASAGVGWTPGRRSSRPVSSGPVPQHLFKRARDQRRVRAKLLQLVGALEQCEHAVADRVRRGLVPRDQEQKAHGHELVPGRMHRRRCHRARSGRSGDRRSRAAR
jgi:hypothetical protein